MFGWISFIQSLIFTLVIIVLLQIKIGDETLEQRTVHWYRTSTIMNPVQEVAQGGAAIIRDAFNKLADSVNIKLFDQVGSRPGTRDVKLRLERSQQYLEEKTRAAAKRIKDELSADKVSRRQRPSSSEKLDSSDDYGHILDDIDTN